MVGWMEMEMEGWGFGLKCMHSDLALFLPFF